MEENEAVCLHSFCSSPDSRMLHKPPYLSIENRAKLKTRICGIISVGDTSSEAVVKEGAAAVSSNPSECDFSFLWNERDRKRGQ